MEKKYARESKKWEDGKFGFLGMTMTFEELRDGTMTEKGKKNSALKVSQPCFCTD